MKICRNCGAELNDLQTRCPDCNEFYVKPENYTNRTYVPNDEGGFLWGLLGFCIPVAGLVLYLVWKDERPETAKACGIGALVNVVGGVIIYILFFFLVFILGGLTGSI
ncbi:MAG: zinc ribbon domain-containing protein [Candidatus Izemoplasmataceae bacterium]